MKMRLASTLTWAVLCIALAGCAANPAGPTVQGGERKENAVRQTVPINAVKLLCVSPDGQLFVLGDTGNLGVELRDREGGLVASLERPWRNADNTKGTVAFSKDSQLLLYGSEHQCWNIAKAEWEDVRKHEDWESLFYDLDLYELGRHGDELGVFSKVDGLVLYSKYVFPQNGLGSYLPTLISKNFVVTSELHGGSMRLDDMRGEEWSFLNREIEPRVWGSSFLVVTSDAKRGITADIAGVDGKDNLYGSYFEKETNSSRELGDWVFEKVPWGGNFVELGLSRSDAFAWLAMKDRILFVDMASGDEITTLMMEIAPRTQFISAGDEVFFVQEDDVHVFNVRSEERALLMPLENEEGDKE